MERIVGKKVQWMLQVKLWIGNSKSALLRVSNLGWAICNLIQERCERKLSYVCRCQYNIEIKVLPFILDRPMDKENILPRVTSFIDSLFTAIDKGSLCKGQLWLFPVCLGFVDTLKNIKQLFWWHKAWKWIALALYANLLTSSSKIRKTKLERKRPSGNDSVFAVHNNNWMTDVLQSGGQR